MKHFATFLCVTRSVQTGACSRPAPLCADVPGGAAGGWFPGFFCPATQGLCNRTPAWSAVPPPHRCASRFTEKVILKTRPRAPASALLLPPHRSPPAAPTEPLDVGIVTTAAGWSVIWRQRTDYCCGSGQNAGQESHAFSISRSGQVTSFFVESAVKLDSNQVLVYKNQQVHCHRVPARTL